MFCYNTSYHRSIKTSPFFLTFGIEARTPAFFATDIRRFLKDDHHTALQRLAEAREIAIENNWLATEKYKEQHDRKAELKDFHVGQMVLLDNFNFLNKNRKLAEKFSGPFKIIRLKGDNNAELVVSNGRKIIVNFQRLRPFHGRDFEINDTGSNDLSLPNQGERTKAEIVQPQAVTLTNEKTNDHLSTELHTAIRTEAETKQKATKVRKQKEPPQALSPPKPRGSGPLTRAQARLASQVATLTAAIKKRRKVYKAESLDPYLYGSGLEVDDSDEPDLGHDAAAAAAAALPQRDADADDVDDNDFLFDEGDDLLFEDADDEDEQEGDVTGHWEVNEDGWKSWREENESFNTPKIGERAEDNRFDLTPFIQGERLIEGDPELDRILVEGGAPGKALQRDLLRQYSFFEQQYNFIANKPHLLRKDEKELEVLRDKGLRLQRLLTRAERLVPSTVGVRHRTPAGRRPTPPPARPRRPGLIRPAQLKFDDDDDE